MNEISATITYFISYLGRKNKTKSELDDESQPEAHPMIKETGNNYQLATSTKGISLVLSALCKWLHNVSDCSPEWVCKYAMNIQSFDYCKGILDFKSKIWQSSRSCNLYSFIFLKNLQVNKSLSEMKIKLNTMKC